MQSLGFVETQGYVPAFAVADAMVKAANVEIVKKVWIGAAMVTIIVRGEVGAVRTAVDSGAAAANRMDALMAATPSPAPRRSWWKCCNAEEVKKNAFLGIY